MTGVTVVMPVLNEERSVAGAVHSVLDQTYTDLELLVLDGDSTDGTAAVVRGLAAVEPRLRLLRNPGRTIPSALNIALREAQGRYLARVDGHASVNDRYLERGVATLDADPAVAAVGGRRIGVASTPAGVAVATALSSRFGVGDSINHYATQAQDTDHASFGVFRVDVLRAIGGWDEQLLVNEDVDLDHRILAAGHRIRFDPQMCIFWHVRESVPALARQYRRYGRGKAAMVLKNGWRAVRPRHAAPPALVLALAGALLALLLGWWQVALLLSGPYLLAVLAASVVTLRSAEPVQPPHVPDAATRSAADRTGEVAAGATGAARGARARLDRLIASFAAMHLGWGLGFLEGALFRLRPATASARVPDRPGAPAPSVSDPIMGDPCVDDTGGHPVDLATPQASDLGRAAGGNRTPTAR
jgi:GT2 family glycosyltransferase